MPDLHNLQADFFKGIFEKDKKIQSVIHNDGKLTPEQRFRIYRNNTFLVLTGILKDTFPVVCQLVDESFFSYATNEFIKQHPPKSGDLHEYGDNFADFLENFEPVKELPYLPDIARLEHSRQEAYLAPDAGSINLEELGRVPEQQIPALTFQLHPGTRLLSSPWPVADIWESHLSDNADFEKIDLSSGPCHLLVSRPKLEVLVTKLSPPTWYFLKALQARKTFAQATQAGLELQENFDVQEVLAYHLSKGTFCDFSTN